MAARTVDRIEELLRNLEILLRCCIAAVLLLLLPSPIWHRGPSHYPASGADKACATVQVPRARKLQAPSDHPCCFLALIPLCHRALAAASLLRTWRPPTFAFEPARRCAGGHSRQPPFLGLPLRLRLAVAPAAAVFPLRQRSRNRPLERHSRNRSGSRTGPGQGCPDNAGRGPSSSDGGGANAAPRLGKCFEPLAFAVFPCYCFFSLERRRSCHGPGALSLDKANATVHVPRSKCPWRL